MNFVDGEQVVFLGEGGLELCFGYYYEKYHCIKTLDGFRMDFEEIEKIQKLNQLHLGLKDAKDII